MRPNEKHRLTTPPVAEEVAEDIPTRVAQQTSTVAGLIQHRENIQRALKETAEARTSGRILEGIEKEYSTLIDLSAGYPPAGPVGTVTVRVVGLFKQKGRSPAPLEGVLLRLLVNDQQVAEEKTDITGVAVLDLPERKAVAYEVEVLDGKCKRLLCDHGRPATDRGAVHRFEVKETDSLAGSFTQAEKWAAAANAARKKADELRGIVTKALDAQEEQLKARLAELKDVLAQCEMQNQGAEPQNAQANKQEDEAAGRDSE